AVLPVPVTLLAWLGDLLKTGGAAPTGSAAELASHTVRSSRPRLVAGAVAATVVVLGALILPWGRHTSPAGPPQVAPRAAPAPDAGIGRPSSSPSPAGAAEL
ncbi:hypothetical protein ACPXCX_54835, partial [Streptomyces sp. DT225]